MARSLSAVVAALVAMIALAVSPTTHAQTSPSLPALTQPVNDFAHVIDAASAGELDRMIRELQRASGDAVVVATVPSIEPYADTREYAVKLFENGGRGIGERGKDNGVLILLAPNSRRVEIEVGYDLEQWITDGYAGDISRGMTTAFRSGDYGAGLIQGTSQIIGRIAQARGVQLTGLPAVEQPARRQRPQLSMSTIIVFIVLALIISRFGGGGGRRNARRWGGGGWSGWSSGVGPFGGGGYYGGGRGGWGGGGGFGGGFGGFGGGRSGGGGGGAGW